MKTKFLSLLVLLTMCVGIYAQGGEPTMFTLDTRVSDASAPTEVTIEDADLVDMTDIETAGFFLLMGDDDNDNHYDIAFTPDGQLVPKGTYFITPDHVTYNAISGTIQAMTVEDGMLSVDVTVEYETIGTYHIHVTAFIPTMEVQATLINDEWQVTLDEDHPTPLDVATGITIDVLNEPDATSLEYHVNELEEKEDYWITGAELAAGEATLDSPCHAQFQQPIYFQKGKRYLVTVLVNLSTTDGSVEVSAVSFEVIGTYQNPDIDTAVRTPLTPTSRHGKYLHDGKIVILRDGKTYHVDGTR